MVNVLLYRFKGRKKRDIDKKTHRATNLTAKACNLCSKENSLPAATSGCSTHIHKLYRIRFNCYFTIGKLFFKRFAINEVFIDQFQAEIGFDKPQNRRKKYI